jgi:hypothetical protein
MKLLRELQAARKAEHHQATEEARLLAQLNLMNGLPYEPEQNGFVFSHTEINRAIDRDNRLKAAKQAAITIQKPAEPQFPIARAA